MCSPLILLLALLSQPPSRDDMAMQNAVESFVITASKRSASPPEPFRTLIEQMGDPCYKCREKATRDLEAASKGDLRWLFWARRHRDPEIKLRANNLLRKLASCPACDGRKLHWFVSSSESTYSCALCGGSSWTDHLGCDNCCQQCMGFGTSWLKDAFE
jgi:hypothetical protein